MKKFSRYILSLLLISWPMQVLWAMSNDEAAAKLASMGMENVRVTANADVVYASFEATSYRGTFRGAAEGIRELSRLYPEVSSIRIVLLENQQPQVALNATKANDVWSVKGDYNYQEINKAFESPKLANKSAGKFDVTVYPMFSWINHRFNQALEYVVSLAPTVETSLWKGNRITLQAVIPVSYDVESIKSASYVHVGIADIAQEVTSANGRWQATLAGGFFYFDRIGFDLRTSYRVTPRLTLGAEASLTGEAIVRDGHYDISKPDHFSFFGKAEYYEPQTRLQGQLMAGRFVYGDYGARMDISRHYGDYTIGLYGILTKNEHNAGFHFAIPLGPKKQMRKGAVRLMLPEYFDWEYSMVSYYEYYDEQMGNGVEIRPDENRSAHYWQPVHIAQYTEKILNNNFK